MIHSLLRTMAAMLRKKTACGIIVSTSLCLSCTSKEEVNIEEDVKAFVCSYYNFRYANALNFCTPESEKWIKFKASNISQEDIDIVRSQPDSAECKVNDIVMNNDTTATARVEVNNFLLNDSIGKPGIMCKSAKFSFVLFKHADHWKVHLTSLPQIEKE